LFAVAACLIAVAVGVALTWAAAGPRNRAIADTTFEPEIAARNVSILGGLAGFAVTGVVLLVGQASNLQKSGVELTDVLTMFVVAYLGLLSASVQLANVAHGVRAPFDLAAAQYAIATTSQYYIYVGWLALRPLFQAFGLTQVADVSGWLVLIAVFAGYPVLATALIRSGYARPIVVAWMALVGVAAGAGYILAVHVLVPGGHVADGTHILTLATFVPGVVMHALAGALPALATQSRIAALLGERLHLIVLAYATSVIVVLQLLLVTVLGFA
jgi:hypothetical protein